MEIKYGGCLMVALISALIIGVTVGNVLAEEFRPYKTTELRLEQGAEDYDLTEGISYRSDRYELDIVNTGDFDIDVPGKYEVEYSLTPVLSDEESGEGAKTETETVEAPQSAATASNANYVPKAVEIISKVTGTVYAEEVPLQETGTYESGELDDGDGKIYFTRNVRVIPRKAGIKYEKNPLYIPRETDLYQLGTATPSEAEWKDASSSDSVKATPDKAEKEEIEESRPTDKYVLSFGNGTLLTEDAYLITEKGVLIPDAEISIKNDRELRNAAEVSADASGETKITLKPGTYHVTLSAVDPENGMEYTCRREIRVSGDDYIYAPDLIVPANTTDYNPLEGVTVKDSEDRTQTADVWIKDMTSLYGAGGNQTATPSSSAYLFAANPSEEYPPLKEDSLYQILLAAVDSEGKEITAVRNIKTSAGHKVFTTVLGKPKKEYGTINQLEPDAINTINTITQKDQYTYGIYIDMSDNDSLKAGEEGLTETVVKNMNGSNLNLISLNLMGHDLALNGDTVFKGNLEWYLGSDNASAPSVPKGTLITNGYKLKTNNVVSLSDLEVDMPPDSTEAVEVNGSLILDNVEFPARAVMRVNSPTPGETQAAESRVSLRSNVKLGGAVIGDNLSLGVKEHGKDNFLGYNRGLGAPTGFEGKEVSVYKDVQMWLSRIKITGGLNFAGAGKLMLVDWQADDTSVSEAGSINVSKNGSTLYFFSARPRNRRPMLTIKGAANFPNTVLTLADLNESGSSEPSITKFEELQENKSSAAMSFQEGDIMIHFNDPKQADASDYRCEIDNNVAGDGKKFILMANRKSGDIYLSVGNIFKVTNNGEEKGFLTLADAAGYLSSRSGNAQITLMTDYTLTSADMEAWENSLKNYDGVITVDSNKEYDGTNRRLRLPGTENVSWEMPGGAAGIEFKNICFSLDGDMTFYANGVPVTFGEGTEILGNKSEANVFTRVFGGSKKEPVVSTSITVESGTFGKIYGGGDGQPVTGEASIAVTDGQIDALYDFDNLSIAGTVTIAKEINSCRNETGKFIGKVSLAPDASLIINGTDKTTGINKIGSLVTEAGTGGAKLCMKRTGNERAPLTLADKYAPLSIKGEPLTLCYTDDTAAQAEADDILLQFTNQAAVSKAGLKNGTAVPGMFVKQDDGTVRLGQLRLFNKLKVEYPDGIDTADEKEITKTLIFTDEIGTVTNFKGGYVIGMPYSLASDPVQSRHFTAPNEGWDGVNGIPGEGQAITLTVSKDKQEGRVENFIHKKNTLYFAHIMDQAGNVYSRIIDTQAPRMVKEPSVTYDEQRQSYQFAITLQDTVVSSSNLPEDPYDPGLKLEYSPQGLTEAAWSEGSAAGNSAADEAAKAENMTEAGGILKDIKNLNSPAGQEAEYVFEIPEDSLKQLMATDKTAVIWIYAKDGNNNTVKLAVPVSRNIMDVSVPVKVKLVALAEPGAINPAPKLLAPVCYIANKGETRVKAEIISFSLSPAEKEARAAGSISLVNKESGFADNELSLKIAPPDNAGDSFAPRNVVNDISPEKPLVLGIMEPGTAGASGVDFTFQASFDPVNIILADNWTTGQLAYRFTIIKNTANQ